MASSTAPSPTIIPAAPNRRFAGVFLWWLRRMMARNWHAVRIDPASVDVLRRLGSEREPAVAVMNHCSWWDPLVGLWLAERFTPARQLIGPMEAQQLSKFKFFTKLGVFGLEPDHPNSLDEVVAYLQGLFRADPATILWITPQGQFADVRVPVRVRPGVAAIAARCRVRRCVSIAIEYGFWTDQRPEIFLRAVDVPPPEGDSTTAWIRVITPAMQANSDELADAVASRDPARFTALLGAGQTRINPLYDLWLRLRGQNPALQAKDRGMAAPVPPPGAPA
jgi:1-acyl-sn-glycerol-3-phosphate acyltransferase